MSDPVTTKQPKSLKGQRKIVCLTADSVPMTHTRYPYCDLLLVGDTKAMGFYDADTAQGADLDMLTQHSQTLIRRRKTAVVIIVLLVRSYESSSEQTLEIKRWALVESGADGGKLESGCQIARNFARLVGSELAVLAHISLLPQRTTSKSGFCIAGRAAEEAKQPASDASALYDTGASSIVKEGIIKPVAVSITAKCPVPKISIGPSQACDGRPLGTEDILGIHVGFTQKFVKKFTDLQSDIIAAATAFHRAVSNETFPLKQHLC